MKNDFQAIDKLIDQIAKQQYLSRYLQHQNYAMSQAERIEQHLCLADCVVEKVQTDSLFVYSQNTVSKFREGDRLWVNSEAKTGSALEKGLLMEWQSLDSETNQIHLKMCYESRGEAIQFFPGQKVHLDDQGQDLYHLQIAALKKLKKHERASAAESFLAGSTQEKRAEIKKNMGEKIVDLASLNDDQKNAFYAAIESFPLSAIQGPAGTGKTHVLAAIALYYARLGFEVVISALSHFAINQALNQIAALQSEEAARKVFLFKMGQRKNQNLSTEVRRVNYLPPKTERGRVCGMTLYRMPRDMRNDQKRILLLDESSQMDLALFMMSFEYFKKTIFLGDDAQLGPIRPRLSGDFSEQVQEEQSPSSLFSHIRHHFPSKIFFLSQSYRMDARLLELPSRLFYNNRLKTALRENKNVSLKYLLAKGEDLRAEGMSKSAYAMIEQILGSDEPRRLVDLRHENEKKLCIPEASLTVMILQSILQKAHYRPSDIAVLVPFRAQQQEIKKRLTRVKHGAEHILVDTVERMQGQERPVILYNLCLSDPDALFQQGEFYFDAGRLNVAMTRASECRIILGSSRLLTRLPEQARLLKEYRYLATLFSEENPLQVSEAQLAFLSETV